MSLVGEVERVARGWRWGRRPLVPASLEQPEYERRVFPTGWVRTPAGRVARTALQRGLLFPVLHAEVDARIHGREVLDSIDPPAVFVANHTSHLDATLLLASLPARWRDRTAVGAASDYFFDTWWRGLATTLFYNAFPVERGARRSLRTGARMLRDGYSIVLFPEGTRSRDGWVAPFRSGAAWLATETGAPVVPVAIAGAYRAMPRGAAWPAAGRPPVVLRFCRPMQPGPGERATAFIGRVRRALAVGLEEERTTWWEALRRDAEGGIPDPAGPEAARWRRVWEASRPARREGRAWGAG